MMTKATDMILRFLKQDLERNLPHSREEFDVLKITPTVIYSFDPKEDEETIKNKAQTKKDIERVSEVSIETKSRNKAVIKHVDGEGDQFQQYETVVSRIPSDLLKRLLLEKSFQGTYLHLGTSYICSNLNVFRGVSLSDPHAKITYRQLDDDTLLCEITNSYFGAKRVGGDNREITSRLPNKEETEGENQEKKEIPLFSTTMQLKFTIDKDKQQVKQEIELFKTHARAAFIDFVNDIEQEKEEEEQRIITTERDFLSFMFGENFELPEYQLSQHEEDHKEDIIEYMESDEPSDEFDDDEDQFVDIPLDELPKSKSLFKNVGKLTAMGIVVTAIVLIAAPVLLPLVGLTAAADAIAGFAGIDVGFDTLATLVGGTALVGFIVSAFKSLKNKLTHRTKTEEDEREKLLSTDDRRHDNVDLNSVGEEGNSPIPVVLIHEATAEIDIQLTQEDSGLSAAQLAAAQQREEIEAMRAANKGPTPDNTYQGSKEAVKKTEHHEEKGLEMQAITEEEDVAEEQQRHTDAHSSKETNEGDNKEEDDDIATIEIHPHQ